MDSPPFFTGYGGGGVSPKTRVIFPKKIHRPLPNFFSIPTGKIFDFFSSKSKNPAYLNPDPKIGGGVGLLPLYGGGGYARDTALVDEIKYGVSRR